MGQIVGNDWQQMHIQTLQDNDHTMAMAKTLLSVQSCLTLVSEQGLIYYLHKDKLVHEPTVSA